MVLHTWGSALTHHPHLHCIVPGGGLSLDGQSWISSRPRYLLPVPVLASLFRRLMCERLAVLHGAGALRFFSDQTSLADHQAFQAFLKPLRAIDWVVYAKAPFAGPDQVLRYLARYTHRVAIANSRLIAFDGARVSFRYKDYRADGAERQKIMTLGADEFMRRFLLHVLPDGFHRIRHVGFLANGGRVAALAKARALLGVPAPKPADAGLVDAAAAPPCPQCGGPMLVVERFERGVTPRYRASSVRIDSS